MMAFKILLLVVMVSQMLAKFMLMMTTYILNYGPIFFSQSNLQWIIYKKYNLLLKTIVFTLWIGVIKIVFFFIFSTAWPETTMNKKIRP